MKTEEEIIFRIKSLGDGPYDTFGFQRSDLLEFLPFGFAKPWLNDGSSEEEWAKEVYKEPSEENVKKKMSAYLEFAWGKARDRRGLSAMRSVQYFKAWLWLLGDQGLLEGFEAAGYGNYGAPKLKVVSDFLGFAVPWEDALRMAQGLPCQAGCLEGCGK